MEPDPFAPDPAPPAGLPAFERAPWTPGDGVALIARAGDADAAEVWTYDALARRAAALAGRLRAQGLRPGQLVAVPERPAARLVLMQHALARSGAALLPGPAADAADADRRAALLEVTGAEWTWCWDQGDDGRLTPNPAGAESPESAGWPSPLALVVATSGSTGAPRAVMLTQANLLAAASASNRHLGLGPGDRWLCCLPLRHIGGLSISYRCALAGAAVLVHPGFEAAAVAADLVQGITHLSLVPPMLARLLDLGVAVPPSLRVVLVGGQSLDPALAGRAIAAGWPLHVTYGMTETASQVATSGRLSAVPVPGSVGRPLPGLEIDCPRGAVAGPLRVRGPVVMAGYATPGRRPGLGLDDGWFTTADLARRGEDGGLCILGRADEVLVSGGVKVHPARVEALLAAAPGAGRVAVVGVPDPAWGARLVALYTGAAAPETLDRWCREHLPGPERPRGFLPCAGLPVLASGKLDRRGMRALAQAAPTPSADR